MGRPTIGARSIPSSEPTAAFASDSRPRPSLTITPSRLEAITPSSVWRLRRLRAASWVLRAVSAICGARSASSATAASGIGLLARQADQRDRAEGGRVVRADGDRDAAGVEHQPVQGARRPALVGQRREAVDLGGLGDQARPDHRLAGPAGGVADADGVEALRRQEGRERLRARRTGRRSSRG